MSGLTPQEVSALLPYFEHAFLTYMEDHTIAGHPRTSRRYSTDDTSPFPALADKLLFILTYLKQNPLQEVQGQLFGMSQAKANKWIHLLHTVLHRTRAHQDLLPARPADALATRLATTQTKEGSTSPLFGMMVLSDRSIAREIPRSSKSSTVARRSAVRSKTCS
jgi:DDE superfamily endonuclease